VEFANVHLWTQNHSEVIAFVPPAASSGTFDAPADAAPESAHFFLAACSQAPIAYSRAFGWLPSSGNVLRERQRHIALLEAEIGKKDVWLSEAHTAQRTLQQEFDKLEAELKERTEWAEQQDRELDKARVAIAELNDEISATRAGYEEQIARSEADAASRLRWIASLERQITDLEEQIARGNAEIARERAEIEARDRLIDERTAWAQSLDRQMNHEREVYRQLEQQHIQMQENLARTQAELEHRRAQLAATAATKWVRLGRRLNLMPPTVGEANG
jgi:chromosome segregation ATPase